MRKNKICIIFGAVLAFNMFSALPVSAEDGDLDYEQLNYKIADDGHVIITNCYQSEKNCIIPEEIDDVPVTEIADDAFSECYFLESLTVPDSVRIIGRQAFSACSALKSIKLPSEIDEIGAGVFDGCSVLESVTLPKVIKTLPEAMFYECTSLKSVVLPEGLEEIGSESFFQCSSIADVDLPSSVTTISDYAFQGCQALKSIDFPENVENIGRYIFQECKSLANITVADENTMFADKDGVLFTKDGNTLIRYPEAKAESAYTVPNDCTQIANGSFVDAVNLKNIDLNNATVYGMDVFFRCTGIESIKLPDGTKDISSSMFAYCSSLKDVSLPNSLRTIGDYAFYTCAALKEIDIPSGTEEIGAYSFFNCIELRNIHLPNSITKIGDGAMGYYAESEDTEPKKLEGVKVDYDQNDVIYKFVEQYDLIGTGKGSSKLWIWIVSISGAAVLIGAIVLIVTLRKKAAVPKPVVGGRKGSELKRSDQKKKG